MIRGETKEDRVWRIAVYIRLSREDGNGESESVVNQKKILREYLEERFDGRYEIVDDYVDDGLTGTDDARADFMRLVQDIENGKITCVLCKTLARAFRNYSDQGYYLEYYFPQKNIRFISMGDPAIDTFKNPDAITGLEVPITGLMNDRYAGRTSNDVRRTLDMKRRRGEFIGSFPPYGYLKDPGNKNHLIPDPDILPVKQAILGWILHDGMSLNGVARTLNELGIPNPTAYKRRLGWTYCNPKAKENDGLWVGTTVRRMLLDRVNLGHMVQGRQRVVSYKVHDRVAVPEEEWFVVENTHEATFSQEEYDRLADLFQRNTRAPNGKRTVHLFSGFLRCADCNKALQRATPKGVVYYCCRTYREKSKTKCSKHTIREEQIAAAVLAAVTLQIALLDSLEEMVEEIRASAEVDAQAQRIEKMLGDKRRERDRARFLSDGLYADWKTGEITGDAYQRMKIKYQEQMEQLAGAIEKLTEEQRRLATTAGAESAAFADFLKRRNVRTLDRNLLLALVDMVFVHENKEITIQFALEDGWARALGLMENPTT